MDAEPVKLWRQPDFIRFWIGVSTSVLGHRMALAAIPLVAALSLQATAGQMGILLAATQLPSLLLTLPAGVWLDRLPRRPILIQTGAARSVLLAAIPAAAVLGVLRIELLYAICFLAGTCQTFYEVAERAYLPTILPPDRLTDGNAKLGVSRTFADSAGPAIAGASVQILSTISVLLASLLFLASTASLRLGRVTELPAIPRGDRQGAKAELTEGLLFLLRQPVLRPLTLCASIFQLCFSALMAVYVLYVTRYLSIEAASLGLILGVGAPGAIVGVLLAERLARRFGWGPTMVASAAVITSAPIMIPLAGGPPVAVMLTLAFSQLAMRIAIGVFSTHYHSFVQSIVPGRLLGRVNATSNFISFGMMPIGSLLGGALGETLGVPLTVLVAAAATPLAMLWLVFSSVGSLRGGLPEPAAATEAAARAA